MAPNRGAAVRKFTDEQAIVEIRELHRDGMSCWRLGVRFGVTSGTIYDIVSGNTYAWIAGAAEALEAKRLKGVAQGERRAYVFAHWQGQSDEEMADHLGVSTSAVSNIRHRLGLKRNEVKRLRMMAAE